MWERERDKRREGDEVLETDDGGGGGTSIAWNRG